MPPWPDPIARLADMIAAVVVAIVSGFMVGTPPTPETDPMPNLSPVELAELVTRHGFRDRVTAVAVILGESGGDPRATNRQQGNIDRGLWQISSKWHPEVSDVEAYDVEASTVHALRISSGGTDYNPWHATKAPAFLGHKRTAAAALVEYDDASGNPNAKYNTPDSVAGTDGPDWTNPGDLLDVTKTAGGTVASKAREVLDPLGDVLGGVGKALSVLTSADFWRRAAFVIAGGVLVLIGFQAIFGTRAAGAVIAAKTGGAVDITDDDDDDE